jgi:hypothetical protein
VEPGGDRGQPTFFYPASSQDGAGLSDRDVTGRRRWWVFKVDVPSTWTPQQRVTWTVRSRGKTNRAAAWLQPEYEVNEDFIRENAADGHLFNGTDFDSGNRPPTLTLAPGGTVSLPGPAMLSLTVADDGRPKAASAQGGRGGRAVGALRARWVTYRGPTRVTFDPDTASSPDGTAAKFAAKATFKEPGTYRLRAIVSDGQLFSTQDVDVTVNPGPSTQTSSR